ncbi:hypothetical protein C8K30_101994 [Promicromonospora sp. AC04]|uniref:hypothetical protein n=1 Tax=Promicromonospora sp. AC04 TaxID=2135723 RepID=UPI000D448641|nr:hypothetical protein [Promicromonospora sp. AC04]PUB32468.1 hypothetical protein C8K30_101994 [Promicromonospora sp. AC04]
MDLDLKRLIYLGYWKIYQLSNIRDFKKISFKVSANFGTSIPGYSSGVGFEKVKDLPLQGGVNKLQLRDLAKKKIREISSTAHVFDSSLESCEGNWCSWSGVSAHAIRGHDDYRVSTQVVAPKIALWVSQSPNQDGTFTLLVLHGTADGNLQGLDLDGLPEDRSGSGTDMIFEYLWSQNRGLALEDFPSPSYSPARVAEVCVWMIGSEREWRRTNIESLFRVHYDEFVPPEGRQISPLAEWSEGPPPVVSRIVIGSPIVVQSPEVDPLRTSGRMKRFWLRVTRSVNPSK